MKNKLVTVLSCVIIVGCVSLVLVPALWRSFQPTAPAPAVGTTLSTILEDGEFIPRFGGTRSRGKGDFYIIMGQVDSTNYPSGPPIVVLDPNLVVVDSTADSGDDPAFLARWGESGMIPEGQPWEEFERTLPEP